MVKSRSFLPFRYAPGRFRNRCGSRYRHKSCWPGAMARVASRTNGWFQPGSARGEVRRRKSIETPAGAAGRPHRMRWRLRSASTAPSISLTKPHRSKILGSVSPKPCRYCKRKFSPRASTVLAAPSPPIPPPEVLTRRHQKNWNRARSDESADPSARASGRS